MKLKILRRTNTEQKIRQATNDDMSKNPTVTDLAELSLLTYKPKSLNVITSVLQRRLSLVFEADHPRLLLLLKTNITRNNSHKVKRNRSTTSRKAKVVVPSCLCTHLPQLVSINKSLLVVLYLMETASCQFISWIKQLHCGWDIPVERLQLFVSGNDNKFAIQHKRSTVENYQHIVGKKLMEIDRLCVNKSLLDEYRLNQHKLRSDMTRPGVKQSPSNRSSSSYSFDDGCELESEVIQIDMDYLRLGHLGNNTSNRENSATARTSMESNRLEVVFELDEEPLMEEMESENSERLSIPISPVFAY